MRLIDANELKKAFKKSENYHSLKLPYDDIIDNAPTVNLDGYVLYGTGLELVSTDWLDEQLGKDRPQRGECKTCRHRDPEDKKCDCGEQERQGCPFPVSDDYFCKFYEKGGAE